MPLLVAYGVTDEKIAAMKKNKIGVWLVCKVKKQLPLFLNYRHRRTSRRSYE